MLRETRAKLLNDFYQIYRQPLGSLVLGLSMLSQGLASISVEIRVLRAAVAAMLGYMKIGNSGMNDKVTLTETNRKRQ